MPFIHFRIHLLDIWYEVRDFLIKNGNHILSIIEKDAERPHIHSVFQFDKTKSTFGQRLKKKFPTLDGNKDFSISQVGDTPDDLQNILKYICKGEEEQLPNVVFHLPKEHYDVMKLHNDYWLTNAELKMSNVKVQSDNTQKQKKISFTEESILQLRKERTNNEAWDMSPNSFATVFAVVINKLGEKAKVFDRSILRRLVFGVLNVLCPQESSSYHYNKSFSQDDFY